MSTRTNYQAQQTVELENLSRPDSLRKPVHGDYGVHGRFEDRAKDESVPVWPVEHIGWHRRASAVIVLALAAAVGSALATLCQGRGKGEWGELGKAGPTGTFRYIGGVEAQVRHPL